MLNRFRARTLPPENSRMTHAPEPDFAAHAERTAVYLPTDAQLRQTLHNEVHARPSARIRLPALVVYVAVLNDGISREQECEHLRQLPGQQHLTVADLQENFLRLRFGTHTLKWERHSEFTRYSLVQPLPPRAELGGVDPDLLSNLAIAPSWLQAIPGQTIAAIKLVLAHADLGDAAHTLEEGRAWFSHRTVVASVMGTNGHSWAVTDFRLRPSGFERMLVLAPPGTSETRAGRISARLLEMETYRLMALLGLPVAKMIMPELGKAERELADITALVDHSAESDPVLLDRLASLAARIERMTADHAYRFAATEAYHGIVKQRIAELREQAIPGTQTLGEFMGRRLSPAMATVASTARRLESLSDRITRTTSLLRTRVDIATESQNQQLLEKLTRGQALQLHLQTTVEGLSIAAISYYVVSLMLYGAKAAKAAGVPVEPEMAAGALIPLVLWAVWRTTRRIHARLHTSDHG